jgi:predicted lipoprotein with Yx(FWY)xxD motif
VINMGTIHLSAGAAGMLAVALAITGCSASASTEQASTAAQIAPPLPATPVGITLVNVVQVVGVAPPDYLWTRLGAADGKTLYTSAADTPGVSHCVQTCAKQFPPLLAGTGAVGFGDWSLVKRPDGTLQWAYQGKPLYTSAAEATLSQEVATLVAQGRPQRPARAQQKEESSHADAAALPAGWAIARFNPQQGLVLPASVGLKTLAVQDGMGDALVSAAGTTLYGYDGPARDAAKATCAPSASATGGCGAMFQPYLAPETASAVGDFSIVKGGSGGDAAQWAYKGVPLYTFSGDRKPTDANGVYGNYGHWHVMFLYLDPFPQNVQAIESVGHGKILANEAGMPLYQRAQFRELFGGPTAYHDYGGAPYMGIALQTGGCAAACLKVRRPLLAPPDAQPHGDWMVYVRPDGTKQWAFQGFALYTYTGDTRPGIVDGHNISDFVVGDAGPYKVADVADPGGGGMGMMGGGSSKAGLFWYVSHPDWLGR